jgi:putative NADH-flavin reductase
MFSQESSKLAVLESKLSIYEELSREMLSKLESAVEKISEGNSRIATILTKHDERIEQSMKTDELIIKMIEDVKEENKQDYSRVMTRLEKLESKVEDFVKFRWLLVGGAIFLSFIFSQSTVVVDMLTPDSQPARVERTK